MKKSQGDINKVAEETAKEIVEKSKSVFIDGEGNRDEWLEKSIKASLLEWWGTALQLEHERIERLMAKMKYHDVRRMVERAKFKWDRAEKQQPISMTTTPRIIETDDLSVPQKENLSMRQELIKTEKIK